MKAPVLPLPLMVLLMNEGTELVALLYARTTSCFPDCDKKMSRETVLRLVRLRLLFRFDGESKGKWCNGGVMGLGVYRCLTGAGRNVAICTCNYTLLGFVTLF